MIRPLCKQSLPLLLLTGMIFINATCLANTAPSIQSYPSLSSSLLIADGARTYWVRTTISDPDGYEDIVDIRVLFNYTEAGGNQAIGRGYLAWALNDYYITRYGGSWTLANANGVGRWGYATDIWGGTTYITPLSCYVSSNGSASGGTGTRTVTWYFKAKPAWAMNPLINDVDVWAGDVSNYNTTWRDNPSEFDVVAEPCTTYAPTPSAPIITSATASSLTVSISPADSDADLYCIRVFPAVLDKDYVQADGSLGTQAVFQTKAEWGTTTIVGLPSFSTFTIKARAARNLPGYGPSDWSSGAVGTTSMLVHEIDYSGMDKLISKGIFGMDAMPKGGHPQLLESSLAVSYNTSMRYGPDGYNWKTRTAPPPGANTQSTLQRLREARDRNSYLQILTNTRGIGVYDGGTWVYTDTSAATLASLAADWVYYCNKLVQTKRQGDPLTPREQSIISSINWGYDEKLLKPGEVLPPKVLHWEIGNEPEGPFPAPVLTPQEYAEKYKAITQAIIAEDPSVLVGPSITTADNGNAWLDAVLSDATNRVDFVCYHPYGNLYYVTRERSAGILNPDDLFMAVNQLRNQQIAKQQKIVNRLIANGRPASTPLVASEWNPSSWEGSYYLNCNRSMAHALGIVDTVFTFAELGFMGAQYWDYPDWPSTTPIEASGQKVFKTLQSYMPDRLLSSFVEPYFRIYTALDTTNSRLIIWVLNLSEYTDKPVRFVLEGDSSNVSVIQHRLGVPTGPTSLATINAPSDPYENIVWVISDLTQSLNPSDFTINFPKATLTMLRIERPHKTLPDGTRIKLLSKEVTAVHPEDGYFYVEEDDRSFGLRVIGDCSGISVGDKVTIVGTIGTLKPDGSTPSERCAYADDISKVGSSGQIAALWMTCRAVGGDEAVGSAGVNHPYGPNNIGLLVRIIGRITRIVDNEHMYVDDGSNLPAPDGNRGVLVRALSTVGCGVDDLVEVTGVVEGKVPAGWVTNQRYIRVRTSDDVRSILS